jgi:hypothetical protein
MRVRDLRKIVQDIARVFEVAGATKQHAAISKVVAALQPHDGRALDAYLDAVEGQLSYARRLKDAGLTERKFIAVFTSLEADKKIKKPELIKIAEEYTGSADHTATAKKLLKHIKTHFYAKLYERDANELAKRATPV